MLLAAIVVQTFAANLTNVYTAGLSLVNTAPRARALPGDRARRGRGGRPLGLPVASSRKRSRGSRTSGNVAAPLTGVVLADYLIRQRGRLDVEALFDPAGRYRYLRGVNVEAVVAVACGIAVYYAVPDAWVKVAWGLGAGAATYLALTSVLRPGTSRPAREPA